jgi:hypothetical protein
VDVNGTPISGALIKAAIAGSSPPTYVGDPATETGGGEYYFKVGTGGGEVPPDYYDVYIDGVLGDAWTNIYIGLGNVPPANSIDSTHVKNGGLLLTSDIKQVYGSTAVAGGTVFTIDWDTHDEATGPENMVSFTADNYGTGRAKYPIVSVIRATQTSSGMRDSTASPHVISWSLDTHPGEGLPIEYYTGPVGIYGRLMAKYQGCGSYVDVRNSDYAPHYGKLSKYAGAFAYVAIDSTQGWWSSGGAKAACFEGRLTVNRAYEGWGFIADLYGDSTVTEMHGAHLRIYGDGASYPKNAFGVYTEPNGQGACYGFKTTARVHGSGSGVYGVHAEAEADTTSGGKYAYGAFLSAMSRPPGQNQGMKKCWGVQAEAGADTAYGGYFSGYSDLDKASNFAYGVVGTADGSPKNVGGRFTADKAWTVYHAVTNKGVVGAARSGAWNYGGVMRATSPATGATNYGAYCWADSGTVANYAIYGRGGGHSQDWAGYLLGKTFMDSTRIGTTSPVSTFPERVSIKEACDNSVAVAIDVRGGDGSTAMWLRGTNGTEDDYLLYMNGAKYGIDQDDVEFNYLGGTTTVADLEAGSLTLTDIGSVASCGEATVASGADTVHVTTTQATGASSTIVLITAVDRSPDGGTPYTVTRSGSFTIHCTTNQSASQKFSWMIVKH